MWSASSILAPLVSNSSRLLYATNIKLLHAILTRRFYSGRPSCASIQFKEWEKKWAFVAWRVEKIAKRRVLVVPISLAVRYMQMLHYSTTQSCLHWEAQYAESSVVLTQWSLFLLQACSTVIFRAVLNHWQWKYKRERNLERKKWRRTDDVSFHHFLCLTELVSWSNKDILWKSARYIKDENNCTRDSHNEKDHGHLFFSLYNNSFFAALCAFTRK